MAFILSIVSNKGGVGKTTIATNLAASFAKAGYRTFLVDLDPAAGSTQCLGIFGEGGPSTADVLMGRMTFPEIAFDSSVPNLRVCLSDGRLEHLINPRQPEDALTDPFALAKALERFPGTDWEPEVIVIDTPPNKSILTVTAIKAADQFLVPVVPEPLAAMGYVSMHEFVGENRDGEPYQIRLLRNKVRPYRPSSTETKLATMTDDQPRFSVEIPASEYFPSSQMGDPPRPAVSSGFGVVRLSPYFDSLVKEILP